MGYLKVTSVIGRGPLSLPDAPGVLKKVEERRCILFGELELKKFCPLQKGGKTEA
jgi:hypothetical protein